MPKTELLGEDIFDGTLTDVDFSGSHKDGSPGTFSLRSLGTGPNQAAAGDDSRFNSVANDPNPSFVVLALTSSLNNERVLSGGLGINLVDQGPGLGAVLDLNVSGTGGISISTGSLGEIILSGSAAKNVPATQVGQVFFSCDGATFVAALPVTSQFGWLVNDTGIHIVNG